MERRRREAALWRNFWKSSDIRRSLNWAVLSRIILNREACIVSCFADCTRLPAFLNKAEIKFYAVRGLCLLCGEIGVELDGSGQMFLQSRGKKFQVAVFQCAVNGFMLRLGLLRTVRCRVNKGGETYSVENVEKGKQAVVFGKTDQSSVENLL